MAASPHDPFFDPESPVFRAHEGGKLGVHATQPLRGREDLALLYTPGVAEVSLAIAADPSLSTRYTARGNTVAVISDGTAVLGLGDIGPLGAVPVMEGKAVLFKHCADSDAVPVVMETGTVEELVDAIARIAPSFGGINLEDISAPRCFDIEEQLKERLDIPVFHDDQHGTAIVVLAGLLNGVRVLGRTLPDLRVVVSGAGAAGVAVTRLLQRAGVRDVVVCDSRGIIEPSRQDLTGHKARLATSSGTKDGYVVSQLEVWVKNSAHNTNKNDVSVFINKSKKAAFKTTDNLRSDGAKATFSPNLRVFPGDKLKMRTAFDIRNASDPTKSCTIQL